MASRVVFLLATLAFAASINGLQNQANPFMDNTPKRSKHNCIHDSIAEHNVPQESTERVFALEGKRGTGGAPIRVVFNTAALNSDPDYVCTTVGQWVKQGEPTGTASTHSPACPATGCTTTNCDCWFQCTQDDILTSQKKNFLLNKVLPDVTEYFASVLNVNGPAGNLVLPGLTTCGCTGTGRVSVPPEYTTTGIQDADIVIFMTARSTRMIGSTIAFACTCGVETGTRRPIAGFINWGPNQIDSADPLAYPEQLGVGIHELTHALGFSRNSYPYFKVANPFTASTLNDPVLGSHDINIFTGAKVVEVARDYFGCPALQGVELENGGGSGTASSHWERRILMNEYMTGYSSYDPVYSVFTLALLEDSGWYFPNYTAASELTWGKGQGCDFVQKRCTARVAPYNCDPTANEGNDEGCTWDGLKKGRCNVREYTGTQDAWYQYYTQYPNGQYLYGNDDFADYCGFYRYQNNYRGDCTISEFNTPGSTDSYYIENYGEVYSSSSRCISATAVQKNNNNEEIEVVGPSCHNFTCVNNVLKMKISNNWYDCDSNSKRIEVTGYTGSFKCPSNVAQVCAASPVTAEWPEFVSISPKTGGVGDSVTIVVKNVSSATVTKVYLGDDYGCVDSSLQQTTSPQGEVTITCSIGKKPEAFNLREDTAVDVVVVDTLGRSAAGIGEFTLEGGSGAASLVLNPFTLFFGVLLALFAHL